MHRLLPVLMMGAAAAAAAGGPDAAPPTTAAASSTPYVWPMPLRLLSTSQDRSASRLSPDLTLAVTSSSPTDEVTASAIDRYGLILRNLSTPAAVKQRERLSPSATTQVTKVEIQIVQATDSATLSVETLYNYSLSLQAGASTVQLRTASRFAVAHGLETLAQLYSRPGEGAAVGPAHFRVDDGPDYKFRALMVDCGRRFVPMQTLRELLDGMSYAKMSVLNFHASEYGFFRIQIHAFPELTAGLGSAFYSQQDIADIVRYAYLRGIRVIPQIDVPGHSSGLIPLKPRGVAFCEDTDSLYCSTSHCQTQLYDDPAGKTLAAVTQIYEELLALFPDRVFDIGGDETKVLANCTMKNLQGFEDKVMALITARGKRPLGWEQIYSVTGAAQRSPTSIVRVYDTGSGADRRHNRSCPMLLNVTSAGHDTVVADSARYYLNSCCPAVHGKRLCELGHMSVSRNTRNPNPDEEKCYFTDIARYDLGNKTLTAQQRKHVLGGSASMWTDAYCATNECGAWHGPVPEAGWMAPSPQHDAAFHDSLLASIFPAAAVAGGAFYRHRPMPMAELNLRWQAFNDEVLIRRGVRSCPSHCQCAEDNMCGQLYSPTDYATNLSSAARSSSASRHKADDTAPPLVESDPARSGDTLRNDDIPPGAVALGYTRVLIDERPHLADINVSISRSLPANPLWWDHQWWKKAVANRSFFEMQSGVLAIGMGGSLTSTPPNMRGKKGLPLLPGRFGFYVEFEVRLSSNSSDHWPAVWLMPIEHNARQEDSYPGDPPHYERWMELDVDEGGFGPGLTCTVHSHVGIYPHYNQTFNRGNVLKKPLNRTQWHTFGASFDPKTQQVSWWLDGTERLSAGPPAVPQIARNQNYYLIISAQTHSTKRGEPAVDYWMLVRRVRAFVARTVEQDEHRHDGGSDAQRHEHNHSASTDCAIIQQANCVSGDHGLSPTHGKGTVKALGKFQTPEQCRDA
eukprot:COSAG01_NODE_3303_length_6294_cov_3.018402_2_plen_967_part_00